MFNSHTISPAWPLSSGTLTASTPRPPPPSPTSPPPEPAVGSPYGGEDGGNKAIPFFSDPSSSLPDLTMCLAWWWRSTVRGGVAYGAVAAGSGLSLAELWGVATGCGRSAPWLELGASLLPDACARLLLGWSLGVHVAASTQSPTPTGSLAGGVRHLRRCSVPHLHPPASDLQPPGPSSPWRRGRPPLP